jgi:hypothetical protein
VAGRRGDRSAVSDLEPSPTTPPVQSITWWRQVNEWKEAGVPRDEWLTRLTAAGLDEESARVVVNSVDGRAPTVLPDASFEPTTNVLSPGSFAFADLGLQGHPATVGLYWLVFGAAVLVMLGVFALMVTFEVVEQPPALLTFIARVMAPIALIAMGFGGWKLFSSVQVRRR